MEKINIVAGLEDLCKASDTVSRGSSFRPFKYYKNVQGRNIPVFFVGVPGLTVAVVMSFLLIITVYLITLPFNIFIWVAYLFLSAVIIRFAMKVDKAKQIRYMVSCLCSQSLRMLEKANEEHHQREKLAGQAKYLLERAHKWVDEPAIHQQIEELKSYKSVVFE
ncbi:hypothetical protein EP073_10165 [Geovibrio thiophilus]|uniref:SLATT domain-containing protein n=1 Tax=Geovibrio thiophilus TaxID=139438 RepID=A0A410K0B8_9BACT|nr:hypothetical protein [Geovibrio thiophilus]QAR33755.1 hypothetical protein EP073_10165 [Geovibrio thiophilus]